MMEAAASGDASILEKLLKQPPVAKNIDATDEEGRCGCQERYCAVFILIALIHRLLSSVYIRCIAADFQLRPPPWGARSCAILNLE